MNTTPVVRGWSPVRIDTWLGSVLGMGEKAYSKSIPFAASRLIVGERELWAMIEEGTFREDLFFRLNVVTVQIPSLRERAVDIPILVNHFLNEYSRIHQKPVEGISREALRILTHYPWPGNVRELKNAVENMVVIATGSTITEEDIPSHVQPSDRRTPVAGVAPVGTTIRELEKELIRNTLASVNGNRKEAASLLGIGERTLYRKITEYELR